MTDLGVDFYTISGHKIGGPKGIGALYINKKLKIAPLIVGGGQETNMRSGTENVPAIAGFAEAVKCFEKYYDKEKTRNVFDNFYKRLTNEGWIYNGSADNNGFILSLSYKGIRSEILQHLLSDEGVLIGLGSACSAKGSNNRVLSALGRTKDEIAGNIRLSFSVFTSIEDAEKACESILRNLEKLKEKMKR